MFEWDIFRQGLRKVSVPLPERTMAPSTVDRSTVRPSWTQPVTLFCGVVGLVLSTGAFSACTREAPAADSASASAATTRTPTYVADVVQSWPHDPDAYTQGLLWHDGRMFESTGVVGKSSIREVDYQTGRVLRKHDVPEPYFGEGIVIMGKDLYEITWTSGIAFVYDAQTFEKKRQYTYEGEGWGLTTDGTSIVMSDGTSAIRFRDPATFAVVRTISVTDHGTPVTQLNELEWVKGEIWANVYQSDQIARIDPATGNVTGWIDLSGLLPKLDRTGSEDVLNGIAYDAKADRYFVTGKLWPKLYEIRLKQRS